MANSINLPTQPVTIGFIPLTDSAPLIMAYELGIFRQWGLDVRLQKQHSWATLRDKLHAGRLDAAQMLAPMPLASSLGLGCQATEVITPMVMSFNGNGITLSTSLYDEVLKVNKLSEVTLPMAAYLLQKVIEKRQATNDRKLRFANVFPYSCHHYQLLDWLASAGIGPDQVDIIVVPPINMVDALQCGDIDGFCVGGPWNAKAVRANVGMTTLTSYDIWQDSPEKVLGILQRYYLDNPATVLALCAALKQACDWLASVPNRFEAARILCKTRYLDEELDVIAPSLIGSCLTKQGQAPRQIEGYNQFSSPAAPNFNKPAKSRGEWLLKQMVQAGQVKPEQIKDNVVDEVFRSDIYREVMELYKNSAPT